MTTHRATRRSATLGLLFAFALIAAACGSSAKSSTTTTTGSSGGSTTTGGPTAAPAGFNQPDYSGTPRIGGSITFAVESDFDTLDPAGTLAQPADVDMALAIYDPLIAYGPSGNLIPWLATKWSSTPDFKTWTITVRTGVKFQDGTDFNAAAVQAQFERFKNPATNCACAPDVQPLTSVDAPNPTTVVFHLSVPNSLWPSTLAGQLGFIASPTATAKWGPQYPRHPVGTGPFSLASYANGVLKKNPYYWRKDANGIQLPYLDQITVKPIADSDTRLQALESGDVDMANTADTSNIVAVVKDHLTQLKVQKVTGTSSTIVLFNLKKPPFNSLLIREAVAYGLNRTQINNVQYQGSREEAYGAFPPDSQYYTPTVVPHYDPAMARKLVNEAKAKGVPTSFTAVCIPTPESETILNLVKQQMQDIGLDETNTFLDQGSLVNEVLTKSGQYQASCFRAPQIADADGLYNSLVTGGSTNVTFYSNATVDKALNDIRATDDPKRQINDLHIVQKQVAKDLPTITILYDLAGNIYSDRIAGVPAPEPWSLGAIKFATLYLKK